MKKPRPVVAVVDDEEAIRKALKRLLRSAGIAVESYASGQEFLQSLPAQRPQCVVLDIGMHGMTGFDVQAQLKVALWRDHLYAPMIRQAR
jgi:FixJ family two-component response regulator